MSDNPASKRVQRTINSVPVIRRCACVRDKIRTTVCTAVKLTRSSITTNSTNETSVFGTPISGTWYVRTSIYLLLIAGNWYSYYCCSTSSTRKPLPQVLAVKPKQKPTNLRMILVRIIELEKNTYDQVPRKQRQPPTSS